MKIIHPRKVECDGHGWQFGYIICRCILDEGKQVKMVFRPENGDLGEILCKRGGSSHSVNELTLICQKCALERQFIDINGDHPKCNGNGY